MTFNDWSTQETASFLNEQSLDKARVCAAGPLDRDDLPTCISTSGGVGKNSKSQKSFSIPPKSAIDPTRSRHVLEKELADRFQGPPLSGSRTSVFFPSPSTNDQSQLHRRNNRHRKAGSRSGKENISPPPPPPVLGQAGKLHTAKSRRPVLANVTNAYQGGFEEVSFASSTSIQSPSRKVVNGEPSAGGLRIELDDKHLIGNNDSREIVIAQDSFVPIVFEAFDRPPSTEDRLESTHASPAGTPLREALAAFNDMLSSTFTSPSKKPISYTKDTSPNAFRLSLRLPAPSLPTGASISNAFNFSILADSLSQLTGDIASSIAARCEADCVYHGQYDEDAVARDERFDWEDEMRCLEMQCGSGGAK